MVHEHSRAGHPAPHRHWSEDELFELAAGLSPAPVDSDCAECRARLDAVSAGIGRLRSVAAERRNAESALVERILAATVRENFDWRGDLALVTNFVRERMRASPWLRFAAALLFIHAAALPVLAWIVLRSEQAAPHFFSALEPLPRESAFAEPVVEPPAPLESGEESEPRLVELSADEHAAKARWAAERERQAASLRAFDWPAARDDGVRAGDGLAQRLWVRSRQATHGDSAPAAWATERARWSSSSLDVERLDLLALELEIELDRVARGADARAARELCEEWAPLIRAGRSELAQWALARAARLGLAQYDDAEAISGALFDSSWFEALRRSAEQPRAQAARSQGEAALVREWLARGDRR